MSDVNQLELQIQFLKADLATLHKDHGDSEYMPIYGAGCINAPDVCLVFMNPTAKNISADPNRPGLRAPRLGFKQIRKMLYDLGFISREMAVKTQSTNRTPSFAYELYQHIADRKIFITNLAKCTQSDAKALPDKVFQEYLPSFYEEIGLIQPKKILCFGNQVSSIILGRPISVSTYEEDNFEIREINNHIFQVYPCRYPVGMGFRNIAKAKERIKSIVGNNNYGDQNSFIESKRDQE